MGLDIADSSIEAVVVGEKMARLFYSCPQNPEYMSHAVRADNLKAAIKFAYRSTGTRNVIIYDGAKSGINASRSLVRFLLDNAPKVEEEVETELMPKWLGQRGLSPKRVDRVTQGVA